MTLLYVNGVHEVQTFTDNNPGMEKLTVVLPAFRLGIRHTWAIKERLVKTFPMVDDVIADTRGFQGVALEALHIGFKTIIFSGPPAAQENLEKIATVYKAHVYPDLKNKG